jgi:hypothetical protein
VRISTQGDTESAGQTEISQFEVTLAVDEQVLGLEITVQDAMAMAVTNTLNQLGHELLHHGVTQAQVGVHHGTIRKSLTTPTLANRQSLHVFFQIAVEELKDKVEFVAVGVNDVQQLDNVGVLHLLEERDLADGGAGDALILGLETDLFQSDNAVGGVQFTGLVNDTVGS